MADKLSGMYKVEREEYEKFWDDISPFIKFGCLKDNKFREKMKDFIIFKNLEGKYVTLPEYVKAAKGEAEVTDEHGEKVEAEVVEDVTSADSAEPKKDTVYYVTDEKQQSQYINMFKENGIDALMLTHNIDQPFISQLEYENQEIRFQRIDADLTENFKEEGEDVATLNEQLSELFKQALGKEKLEVQVERMKSEKISAMITLSEESRRMQDMMKMYRMPGMEGDMFAGGEKLVLNANHPLVQFLGENKESEHAGMLCEQLYDLAVLAHRPLEPEAMTKFVERSNALMLLLTK